MKAIVATTVLVFVWSAAVAYPLPPVCQGIETMATQSVPPQDDAALECVLLYRDLTNAEANLAEVAALGDALYRLDRLEALKVDVKRTRSAIVRRFQALNKQLSYAQMTDDNSTVLVALSHDGKKQYRCMFDQHRVELRCRAEDVAKYTAPKVVAKATSVPATVAPVTTCVNLREHPTKDAKVLRCFRKGTRLDVLSESVGGYTLVDADGTKGWIANVYIIKRSER